MRQQFKQSKPKPIFQSSNIKFPERVWESSEGGWSTRPVTADDLVARKAVAEKLNAVILA